MPADEGLNHEYMAQPGRLRRPGRGLKTAVKSANSQFNQPPHTQKFGHRLAATLTGKRALTHDITEFTFRSPGLADFLPGQYALLQIPGVGAQRAYSMSNLPNVIGEWQFIIRRVADGAATGHLFEHMPPGAALDIDGPYGLACLRPIARDVVCIAGGSGLAPMLSIARAASTAPELLGRRLHFFYGGRSPRDMAAGPLLSHLSGFGDRIRYVEAISQSDGAQDWSGHVGFIHDLVDRKLGDELAQCEVYLAGPPPIVQATLDTLMLRRAVPFAQIHYDRFF